MPFVIEEDGTSDALSDVRRLVVEHGQSMFSPQVREFPLGAHTLSRKADGAGWDPKPAHSGLVYAVTDGEDDDDSLVPVLRNDEGGACFLTSEGASTAMLNAISWAGSRRGYCTVRFLQVPGGIDAFWASDGTEEVFFPVDYGHLMSGPEFASNLRTMRPGREWAEWDDEAGQDE